MNYWLKLRSQKQGFWTVEFSKHSIYLLKPRRLEVLNSKEAFYPTSSQNQIKISFSGGSSNSNDKELLDLLMNARKGMGGWLARLRRFSYSFVEKGYHECFDLSFGSIITGSNLEDVELWFDYGRITTVGQPT
jgi:hypothetical protein